MGIRNSLREIKEIPFRNFKDINGKIVTNEQIICEHWVNPVHNLGDELVEPIIQYMLNKKAIEFPERKFCKPKHLLTIGSAIGLGMFDAVVWGTGIHKIGSISSLIRSSTTRKFDIRAVRGPITRWFLKETGYNCPQVYGDPGILMPLIYNPILEKKFDCSVVCHFNRAGQSKKLDNIHYIDIQTKDYKNFIDEIVQSKKVISSSLHGIILAETYGVPTVFWNDSMYSEIMKYYDWYYSTERMSFSMASNIDEAIQMQPSVLPVLEGMREDLIKAFPYDLWTNACK